MEGYKCAFADPSRFHPPIIHMLPGRIMTSRCPVVSFVRGQVEVVRVTYTRDETIRHPPFKHAIFETLRQALPRNPSFLYINLDHVNQDLNNLVVFLVRQPFEE